MQAIKSCHLPIKLPATTSLPRLPPPTYNPAQHTTVPRAISISAPTTTAIPGIPTTVQDTNASDDAVAAFWDYQFLFVSQRAETVKPVSLRLVDGALPHDFPSGTYYLTGPGLFADDHGSTVHPLDGHGYLRSFKIDGGGGKVEFMAKYIETEAQVEERDPDTGEWRFTHRGPFSVLKGANMVGNTKVMKNVANTSVLRWGGRLFCLWEGGDPYEIEPQTLGTVGRFDLVDGRKMSPEVYDAGNRFRDSIVDIAARILKPLLYGVFKMPPKRLLSHYKIDEKRNRLLIMSCNAEDMLLPRSNFTIFELDSNMKLLQSQEFSIPDHLMIHDWAFTDSHYILFGNRIKLDVAGSMTALCGFSPMISALSVNPSKSTSPIYLLPRFSDTKSKGSRDWRVPIEAPSQMWVLHVGNAFQEKCVNGDVQIQIQATSCSYQWFNFQKMFGYDWQSDKLDPSVMNLKQGQETLLPHLVKVNIRLDADGKCQDCSVDNLTEWSKPSDFPVINQEFSGVRNTYIYAATSSGSRRALPHFPFDMVVKMNTATKSTQTWSTGRRRFIGEPVFIPKPGGKAEDDGFLLVIEYAVSTQRCYLVVLDSKLIGKKNVLVARFEVPRHLNFPLGFHGFWAPSVCATASMNCQVTSPAERDFSLDCVGASRC